MELKPGQRLASAVCDTEVVVVKAPAADVDLRCGGHPMTLKGEAAPAPSSTTHRDRHAGRQALRRRGRRHRGAVHEGRRRARSRSASTRCR